MNGNELIVLAAAGALQLITLWAWAAARAEARAYIRAYHNMIDAYAQLQHNSIRRDPRTGRYVKKGR